MGGKGKLKEPFALPQVNIVFVKNLLHKSYTEVPITFMLLTYVFIFSQMESGGTVLSTNWKEVAGQKVDVKPPDGMEWKKWNQ